MKRAVLIILCACATSLFFSGSLLVIGRLSFASSVALAEGGWKAEFDAVCSKTDVAMTHTVDDLKGWVARCDQLKPRIEAEEESTRKVYLRRLQMCRDLFIYVLESKESK